MLTCRAGVNCTSIVSDRDIYAHEVLRIHDDRIAKGLIQIQLSLGTNSPLAGIPVEFFYGDDYFAADGGAVTTCSCHSNCALKPVGERTRLRMHSQVRDTFYFNFDESICLTA